jgi:iron(III) transport system ATP-binding protein
MTGLVVTDLYKSFGRQPVLEGVNLEVPTGEVTAILGPSGSGKTTLLRVLAGFERADRGTVTVDGRVVEGAGRHVPPQGRQIGYVPQEGALFPHLTVAANVGFGLRRAERRTRVAELLDMIGLRALAGRYPHELSGGQQQRVALARALATRPGIVLLDEPFSSLDAALRSSVRQDVARVLAEARTTAVLVTHDQDEALSMASRVAVLRDGQFVQYGTALDVYCHPVDADVARFVGEANLLAGSARAGAAVTGLGSHPVLSGRFADGTPLLVLVRPEQVEVLASEASGGPAGAAAAGWTAGTVVAVDYHGHDTMVSVDAGAVSSQPVHARFPGNSPFETGARVVLRAAAGAVTAWPAPAGPSAGGSPVPGAGGSGVAPVPSAGGSPVPGAGGSGVAPVPSAGGLPVPGAGGSGGRAAT